jgi:hypothetical protein
VAWFNNPASWDTDINDDNHIGPGDVVYFSGTITDHVIPQGSGNSSAVITLDGYEAGDCDYINSTCPSAAVFQDGVSITNHTIDYVTMRDIDIQGGSHYTGVGIYAVPDSGKSMDYFTLERVKISNTLDRWVSLNGQNSTIDSLTIKECYFSNYGVGGDPANGLNIQHCEEFIVEGNKIINDQDVCTTTSSNVIELHQAQYGLIWKNWIQGGDPQGGIEIKEFGAQDIMITQNYFTDNGDSYSGRDIGIGWPASTRVYIWGNVFNGGNTGTPQTGGASGVQPYDGSSYVFCVVQSFLRA